MSWGDCDTCINIDTELCDECIYDEEGYYEDHYEEATSEKIAKRREEEQRRKKEERKKAEDSMCQEYIQLSLSPEFCDIFNRAKMFTSKDPEWPQWMVVWARKNMLVATNMYMLCELDCQVPDALQNKYITRLESNRAAIATQYPTLCGMKPLVFPVNYAVCLNDFKWLINNPDFDQITMRTKESDMEVVEMTCGETEIWLDAGYYDTVLIALGEIDWLGYTDERSAVVFNSRIGRAALLPILKPVCILA